MSNHGARRRRPRSYHHRANVTTNEYNDEDYSTAGSTAQTQPLAVSDAEFTTLSLLDDAAERHDFDAIQRELRFALGGNAGESHWMPQATPDLPNRISQLPFNSSANGSSTAVDSGRSPDVTRDTLAPTDDPAVLPPRSPQPRTVLPRPPPLSINTHLSPFDARDLNPSPRSPATPLSAQSDAESPAKFSDMLNRVSERIVGLGANAPAPASSHLGAELAVSRSRDSKRFSTDALSVLSFRSHGRKSGESARASYDDRASSLHVPLVGITVTDAVGGTTSVDSPTAMLGPIVGPSISAMSDIESAGDSVNDVVSDVASAVALATSITTVPPPALYGNSLCIFPPTSTVRQRCHRALQHRATNVLLLAIMGLQIGLLSYRQWNPYRDGYVAHGYNWADYVLIVLNVIYTIEIATRAVAYGLYDDRATYAGLGLPYPDNPVAKKLWQGAPSAVAQRLVRWWHRARGKSAATTTTNNAVLEDLHPVLSASTASSQTTANTTTNTAVPSAIVPNARPIRAFLQSSWHRIDFISTVSFWISLVLSIHHYDARHNVLIFRALSCLRILRLCNLTTGTTTILAALKLAVPQLIDVSIFIGCFGLFFGIVGVQSFKSSLTRHCVWTNPDNSLETWVNTDSYCGGYLDTAGHSRPYFYRDGTQSSSIKGLRCPVYSQCVSSDNPYDGTVSFDNIFNSLEIVFVIILANTFTDIMYNTMDSDGLVACLFYVLCLFVMTVWLLNVFIAIVVASYRGVGPAVRSKLVRHWQRVFARATAPLPQEDRLSWRDLWRRLRGTRTNANTATNTTSTTTTTSVTPRTVYYTIEPIFPVLIIADLVIQACRRANQSRHLDHALYRLEAAFTAVFALEIVVRFVVHLPHPRLFFRRRRNTADLALAVITAVIIIEPVKNALGHAYYWLTVFQIMRFYRVILMSRFTRNLWVRILANAKEIMDLTEFLFVLIFLTSVIFARFFEGVALPDDLDPLEVPFSLQTLPNTVVGLYTITSTENWTNILYPLQGLQTNGPARVFTAVFLIGWFVVLNFVVLNIFIAVIASSLVVPETDKRRRQLLQFIENITASIHSVDNESGALARFKNRFFRRTGSKERYQMAVVNLLLSGTGVSEFLDNGQGERADEVAQASAPATATDDSQIHLLPTNPVRRFFALNYRRFFNNPFRTPRAATTTLDAFDPTRYARSILRDRNQLIAAQNNFLHANPTYNKVFYVIGPRHPLRRLCQRIVLSSYGERIDGVEPYKRVLEVFALVMFIATLALVVVACYLTPLIRAKVVQQHGHYGWSFWTDVGFLAVFTAEFAVRVVADGFCFTPNAYVRLAWNNIDFVVLLSLWIEIGLYINNDGDLSRFVRGFKALRALRLLTISETAKNNFHHTMLSGSGVKNIAGAAVMSMCLLLPFALWGLNIFHGRLGYCLDGLSRADCHNEYLAQVFNWDVVSPNAYVQPPLQFDNFPHAILSLFEITSLEGWVDLLYNVMASTGAGTPPESFATPFNGVYVVLFNFVGIVFILTVFISVIIHNYALTTGQAYMTMPQRSWYQVKKFLVQVRPRRTPDYTAMGPVRTWCYRTAVVRDPIWATVLNLMLVLHFIALAAEAFPQPDVIDTIRFVVFLVVSLVFSVDAVMLVVARGVRASIRSRWLVFYTVVLFGALITTIIGSRVSLLSAYTNIYKLFLVGTLFFFIPRSDRLSQFLQVASASWPNLFSLLFTWVVLFLVFAIALNQVFGTTRIGPNGTSSLNLRTVPKSLVVLFRCSFGEGWNYIMDDYKMEEPLCYSKDSTTDCGSKQYAYFLFIAWNVISMYIFLNMFVSLILDSFSYITASTAMVGSGETSGGSLGEAGAVDAATLMDRRSVRQFKDAWCQYDPRGTGFIAVADLPRVLAQLSGPFSLPRYHPTQKLDYLLPRWFTRNSPDPYDVTCHFHRAHRDLALPLWDRHSLRARRLAYETFLEEAAVAMELNNEPGILFTRVLLQLPLYSSYDTATCLNLIDFLERRLLLQRVKKRLDKKRVEAMMVAWAVRWQYRAGRLAPRDSHLDDASTSASTGSSERDLLAVDTADESYQGQSYHDYDETNPFMDSHHDHHQQSSLSPVQSPVLGSEPPAQNTPSGVYVPRSPLFNRHAKFSLPSRAPTGDGEAVVPHSPLRF